MKLLLAALGLWVVPGLAWVAVRDDEPTMALFVRVVIRSLALVIGVVVVGWLFRIAPTAPGFLVTVLGLTAVGLLRRVTAQNGRRLRQRGRRAWRRWLLLGAACGGLFVLLSALAVAVVPPMLDHDWDSQSPAYALMHTGRPTAVTDRGVLTSFCAPPLLSVQIGLVALLHGSLDALAYHYEMAQQLRAAYGDRPPEAIWQAAARQSQQRFLADPHLLETRTPTLCYATATLPLLYLILESLTASPGLSAVGCLLYFTFPEALVRSAHGGYTAIAIFWLLVTCWGFLRGDGRTTALGSAVGVLAKTQTVFLPLAIAGWVGLREARGTIVGRLRVIGRHPAVLGGLAGAALLAVYGWWADPRAFWDDYVLGHLWNRLAHVDTGGSYPSVIQLWRQFDVVLGRPFLPLAAGSVVWLLARSWRTGDRTGVIAGWAIVGAVLASVVDWRQTKHLMPIVPALVMAAMALIARQRGLVRGLLVGVLAVVILHNVWRLAGAWPDLLTLHPTGDW